MMCLFSRLSMAKADLKNCHSWLCLERLSSPQCRKGGAGASLFLLDSCAHGACGGQHSSSLALTLLPVPFVVQVHPSCHISQGHCHHCGCQWQHEGPEDDHCQAHHHHHFGYSGRK